MSTNQSTPSDIHPSLTYNDAPAAIDWLCNAYGFTKRLVVPGEGGRIDHSELSLGTGVIMVSSAAPEAGRVSPRDLQGRAGGLSVFVPDPDAHYRQAVAAGAHIVRPLQDEEYGARGYLTEDLEGHQWYFGNYRPGAYWQAEE
ncbi:MAG TPA: VOC family protein [Candidatus Kapabacteria bacterium]|nr:VOC family protein [Candidatus Kapabacteria bacterium]